MPAANRPNPASGGEPPRPATRPAPAAKPPAATGAARAYPGTGGPGLPAERDRRAAVLGKPIAHSLSPVIHRAGFRAAGLTGWSYTSIECAESELADLVDSLGPAWVGLSLTMPLKRVSVEIADEISPLAATLGSANTLLRRPGGGWYADNTDAPGMVNALRHAAGGGAEGAGRRADAVDHVAVLGAGGTARAALGAAAHLGAAGVTVYARRPAEVPADLGPVAERLGLDLTVADWARAADCGAAPVVISTVPVGAADHLAPIVEWTPGMLLLDVVYEPWPTDLAAAARASGARVASGLELLLAQAVGQFELFTGVVPAPVAPMRHAMLEAVAAR